MSNEYFIPKPVIFFTETDALNHINQSQMSTSKSAGNQWMVYLLIGAVIVGVIVYSNYLYKKPGIRIQSTTRKEITKERKLLFPL